MIVGYICQIYSWWYITLHFAYTVHDNGRGLFIYDVKMISYRSVIDATKMNIWIPLLRDASISTYTREMQGDWVIWLMLDYLSIESFIHLQTIAYTTEMIIQDVFIRWQIYQIDNNYFSYFKNNKV